MGIVKDRVIAHRGESFDAPENSLSAINKAWQNGAKAVEVDVQLTSDNQIVVIHDKHTGRVGNKKLVVKRSGLIDLKKIDIGEKKHTAYKGERIPTLKEVLETLPLGAKLIVEVKCGNEIVNPLVQLLVNAKLRDDQIEFISFSLNVLISIKKELPHYKILWLLDLDYYLPHWMIRSDPKSIIRKIKANGLDGVDVWAGKVVTGAFVQAFKIEGLCVYVWTVNQVCQAIRVLGFGVDAVTTDRAGWLSKQLLEIM